MTNDSSDDWMVAVKNVMCGNEPGSIALLLFSVNDQPPAGEQSITTVYDDDDGW